MSARCVRLPGVLCLSALLSQPALSSGCAGRGAVVERAVAGSDAASVGPYVSPFQYEHYLRGEIALEQGHPAEAAGAFAAARTGSADDGYLRARHVVALTRAGDWSRAERTLSDSLRRFPESHALRLAEAELAQAQAEDERALRALAEAERLAPSSPEAPLAVAGLLDALGRPEEAEAHLEAFLGRAADARVLQARLAFLMRRGDLDGALRLLSVSGGVRSGDRGDGEVAAGAVAPAVVRGRMLRQVAQLALEAGRPEVTARLLGGLPPSASDTPLRVRALALLGRRAEAEALLAVVAEADLGGPLARAELYLVAGRPDVALEILSDACLGADARCGAPSEHLYWLGRAHLEARQPAEAALYLARVPRHSEHAAAAREALLHALRAAGLPELADELQQAR